MFQQNISFKAWGIANWKPLNALEKVELNGSRNIILEINENVDQTEAVDKRSSVKNVFLKIWQN